MRAPDNDTPAPKVSFVSLGCPKALVDSERIVTRLRAEGYELARDHAGADLVVVNTCGFLDSAKAEVARRHRQGAQGQRQGDRHRLHGGGAGEHFVGLSGRAGDHRSAAIRERGRGGAQSAAAQARSVSRSGAAGRHQAHAAALRVSEDFRRLQQPLHLLHHPAPARRSGLAPGRRRAARGREAGQSRREGTAGDLAGHVRLWARSQICRERMARARGAREIHRSRPRTRRTRHLGAAALRLSLSACR